MATTTVSHASPVNSLFNTKQPAKTGAVSWEGGLDNDTAFGVGKQGSLASTLEPKNSVGYVDIVRWYPWTMSKIVEDMTWEVPSVQLREFQVNEGTLKRQLMFYAQGVGDFTGITGDRGVLGAYDEIFPKDKPTKWKYRFPYYSKVNYDLTTSEWATLEGIGKAASETSGGAQSALKGMGTGGTAMAGKLDIASQVVEAGFGAASNLMKTMYPLVGIADRPRIFQNHSSRTIEVDFVLYNTKQPNDWKQNRNFLYLFMNQNLFNKKNFILGIPPVFYEVYIPGQYFSIASSVSKINVENLGNQRVMYDDEGIAAVVPDAYRFTCSLTEMVMPSKNLLEAVRNGEAQKRVDSNVAYKPISQGSMDSALKSAKDLIPKQAQAQAQNQ
jgi:hypothetical protein